MAATIDESMLALEYITLKAAESPRTLVVG